MALHNVQQFILQADSARSAEYDSRLACLAPFANDPLGAFPADGYQDQPESYRDSCRADLAWVHDDLTDLEDVYVPVTSAEAFSTAVRSIVVAQQFESVRSGLMSRDAAMADNALWLLDQLGPGSRMVLWAHNLHVWKEPGWMGSHLEGALGDDYVSLGFAAHNGVFSGVLQSGSGFLAITDLGLPDVPPDSYEAYFNSLGRNLFFLDLRGHPTNQEESAWIHGPRPLRSIGCCYDPAKPDFYYIPAELTRQFDFAIYSKWSTPSRRLPYAPPSTF